jgi:uncharacterized membrane protein
MRPSYPGTPDPGGDEPEPGQEPQQEPPDPDPLPEWQPETNPSIPVPRAWLEGIPFPDPEVLRQLDEVVSHGAERAFSLAEREQAHRLEMERMRLSAQLHPRRKNFSESYLVITLSFVFLGLALAGAIIIAAINGHGWGNASSSIISVGAAVTVVGEYLGLRSSPVGSKRRGTRK